MATRAEVAAEMARKKRGVSTVSAEDVSQGVAPPVASYEVPQSGAQTERAEPGEPIPVPQEKEYRAPVLWGGGLPVPKESGIRDVLDVASGGGTEAVNTAVQGAKDQAGKEVEGKGLTVKPTSPEELARLQAEANPESGAGGMLVRTPAGWQPSSRTGAQGETGKDPAAVGEALKLQASASGHDLTAQKQTQEADRNQYEMLHQVQQNEFRATQSFKKQADELDDRYTRERDAQMAKLSSIQKAMDAVPNAPRTIRQKLDQSGTGDKIAFGLAAAFSVLGGASLHDGGASVQTFLKTVQGNIDRLVQKENDEYARLGDRARMSDNIYGHLRTGLQDDQAAMNITKALYYDAAANTVEQIATQYKMDTQAPQVQQLIAHLQRERQKLIVDTAATLQDQTSQTDKYNPGGLALVGGGKKTKDMYDSEPLAKGLAAYGEQIEKRGANSAKRAAALLQKAVTTMQGAGKEREDVFWKAVAANEAGNSALMRTYLAQMPESDKKALSYITEANAEQLHELSGANVTVSEMVRDAIKKGGYSISSLDRVRDTLLKKRENVYHSVDATHGGRGGIIGHTYRAREKLSEVERLNPGIGTDEPQAIDPSDLRSQVRGELSQ